MYLFIYLLLTIFAGLVLHSNNLWVKIVSREIYTFFCVCSHTVLQLYLLVIWTGFAVDDLTSMKSNLYQEGRARGGA